MAEPKTKPTDASVADFLNAIADPARRKDCKAVSTLMRRVSGAKARMWGDAIVGFGDHHYTYASGKPAHWPRLAFSPRKQDLTLYLLGGFASQAALLARLGRHKTGKCCLYLKTLDGIDLTVLEELMRASLAALDKNGAGDA